MDEIDEMEEIRGFFLEEAEELFENINSITGVGQKGAIALLHLFLKYPEANQRQITSLARLILFTDNQEHQFNQNILYLKRVLNFTEEYFLWECFQL